jgi:hypothetical protein
MADGDSRKLSSQGVKKYLMLDSQTILLGLVTWHEVCVVTVNATIFRHKVEIF